jgi:cytochrome b561
MEKTRPHKSAVSRILARLKHGLLIALFILVPFAGAFHPKLRKRENPDDKEIGAEK